MKILKCIVTVAIVFVTASCSLLEPESENFNTFDRVLNDPFWTDGLMVRGYASLQNVVGNVYRWDEVATDDAVSNDPSNNYRRMANGGWSSSSNPQSIWTDCYEGIMYLNQFLETVDQVTFRLESQIWDKLIKRRLKGEAFALRGMLKYYLLRNHGGVGTNGELLGTPVYDEFLDLNADFRKQREKFEHCVENAYQDFKQARELLPFDYFNINNINELPDNFSELKTGDQTTLEANIIFYNEACGNKVRQRASGRIVLAFQMRLALLQASQAFNLNNNTDLWIKAAVYAAELLDNMDEPAELDPVGHIFYLGSQVNRCNLENNRDLPEFVWRKPKTSTTSSYELSNFPPSHEGNGRINPTQNLVDAFPMLDGYPAGKSPKYVYEANDPYRNRDPRLAMTVVYNGSELRNGMVVNTAIEDGIDGLGSLITSTRTGYYLRKLLRNDVRVGNITTNQPHIEPFVRYTEVFLTYAEAINEVEGPDGGSKYYTPRTIIGDIRQRGGIEASDPYLASIISKEDMREMIRNERRIELSFESTRFWDLRRWNISLIESAKGVRINKDTGVHEKFDVEARDYRDFMIYGPIPKNEVDKFNLIQNKGW